MSQPKRYSVFDYADKEDPDYFFKPLVFLEHFSSLALELNVGPYKIKVPSDWSIVLAAPDTGDIELVPVEDINNRDFHVFSFNPLTGFYPKFLPVGLNDLFRDMHWTFPKLDHRNFLMAPLSKDDNPDCIMLINEKDQKRMPPLEMPELV